MFLLWKYKKLQEPVIIIGAALVGYFLRFLFLRTVTQKSNYNIEWRVSKEPVHFEEALNFMQQRVEEIIAGTAPQMRASSAQGAREAIGALIRWNRYG